MLLYLKNNIINKYRVRHRYHKKRTHHNEPQLERLHKAHVAPRALVVDVRHDDVLERARDDGSAPKVHRVHDRVGGDVPGDPVLGDGLAHDTQEGRRPRRIVDEEREYAGQARDNQNKVPWEVFL